MAQFQAVLQSQPVSALKLTVAEASLSGFLQQNCVWNRPVMHTMKTSFAIIFFRISEQVSYGYDNTPAEWFVFEKLQSGRLCGTGGLSARFVQDIMRVYHSIEQYAVQEYHIHGTHFTMPKAEKKQLDVLSSEERKKLEQYLLQTGLTVDLAILLCLFTGLRVGELCGLQWSDIDFENGTLSVKRTVQRVYRNGCSEVLIGSPKSRTSVRTIPVPSFLLTLLEKKSDRIFCTWLLGKANRQNREPCSIGFRKSWNSVVSGRSISSASTHLCHRLYCPWVWCKDAEWIARTRWCQYYFESICAFLYADEAGIYKAIAIGGIMFRRQKIVWKMQKVSETAWFLGLNGQWADFTKQKCFFPFSISSDKPSILLAFWDFLWYYGNRERKLRKGYITWFV